MNKNLLRFWGVIVLIAFVTAVLDFITTIFSYTDSILRGMVIKYLGGNLFLAVFISSYIMPYVVFLIRKYSLGNLDFKKTNIKIIGLFLVTTSILWILIGGWWFISMMGGMETSGAGLFSGLMMGGLPLYGGYLNLKSMKQLKPLFFE